MTGCMMFFTYPIDDELELRLVEPRHAQEIFDVVDVLVVVTHMPS